MCIIFHHTYSSESGSLQISASPVIEASRLHRQQKQILNTNGCLLRVWQLVWNVHIAACTGGITIAVLELITARGMADYSHIEFSLVIAR